MMAKPSQLIEHAPRLPFPILKSDVKPYLEAKNIPPIDVFLTFQEHYGSRVFYSPMIDHVIHLGLIKGYTSYEGTQRLPRTEVTASALMMWETLLVICGDIPTADGIFHPMSLDSTGTIYFSFRPWASSIQRWLETEDIAGDMQSMQLSWVHAMNDFIRAPGIYNGVDHFLATPSMVDLGALVGLPQLTHDGLPFQVWWGNDRVRIQTYALGPREVLDSTMWTVSLYGRTRADLEPLLEPIHQALRSTVKTDDDLGGWRFSKWPRNAPTKR